MRIMHGKCNFIEKIAGKSRSDGHLFLAELIKIRVVPEKVQKSVCFLKIYAIIERKNHKEGAAW